MKHWLLGAVALFIATDAAAQNYQLAYSPSLKLEIWIDNVQSKDVASWCAKQVPIRIVSRESQDPRVLNSFLPQVTGLMTSQCHAMRELNWQMNDVNGKALGQGQVQKANNWAVNIAAQSTNIAAQSTTAASQTPVTAPATPAPSTPMTASVASAAPAPIAAVPQAASTVADATPWVTFSQLGSCHFRTWWPTSGQVSSLFVPDQKDQHCQGGWLNGPGKVTYSGSAGSASTTVDFINGFPVEGLKKTDSALQIVTANNQRVVLSNDKSSDSWLILPWHQQGNSGNANGTIALHITPQQAADNDLLQARVKDARKNWAKYLDSAALSVSLVPALATQLQNPAAGAFRILN